MILLKNIVETITLYIQAAKTVLWLLFEIIFVSKVDIFVEKSSLKFIKTVWFLF